MILQKQHLGLPIGDFYDWSKIKIHERTQRNLLTGQIYNIYKKNY